MYHINPACIKSILRSMPRKEFIKQMNIIKGKMNDSEEGTQEYFKFKRLYEWGSDIRERDNILL